MVLVLSMVVLLGVSIGDSTVWGELITVVLLPEGSTVAFLGDSNDVIGSVELGVVFNKIWRSEVK